MLVTLVTPVRTTVMVAVPAASFTTNRLVLNCRSMSSLKIVSSALLRLSDAELAGVLTTLVSTRLTVRSAFTTASLVIPTVRFVVVCPGTKATTLLTKP